MFLCENIVKCKLYSKNTASTDGPSLTDLRTKDEQVLLFCIAIQF
jgi:hypothetical protein